MNDLLILWVSGLTWEIADNIHTIESLRMEGTVVTALEPVPITGPGPQAWQMVTGQNSGQTGYFDTWTPRQYAAQPVTQPDMPGLHEIIVAAGRTSMTMDVGLAEVPSYLRSSAVAVDCLIVRTRVDDDPAVLAEAIDAARAWVGADGALLVLSEQQEATVRGYVNLNDGLHALGILDVSAQYTISWEETLAYHVGHGQLWMNLRGREPSGIITSGDEYEQVCQTLARSLPTKLLDPQTREPVIERVYRRQDVYHGDYLFQAPDLVVVFREGYAPSPKSVALGLDGVAVWPAPVDTRTTAGLHPRSVAGLALAVGTPFAAGRVLAQAPLVNIAPTILYALRLPIPASLEGEVITELFPAPFLQQCPIQRVECGSSLSPEEEEEIMARLKSLGYIG